MTEYPHYLKKMNEEMGGWMKNEESMNEEKTMIIGF